MPNGPGAQSAGANAGGADAGGDEADPEARLEAHRDSRVDIPRREESERLRQAELIISYVLRGGVFLAAAIISLGVVLFYARYLRAGGHIGPLVYPKTASAVFAGLAHGDPVAVIALGLLVLLLTPVLRVLVSVVTFALERDRLYTAITLLVFFILLVSFLLGRGGS